ncbi:methyltransferase family protein [Gayadomonas joobiniege]|uniref:methyltransferase family protein n=1 Tax=Gayadomonas joobiniege TaxID=1234606 RepID=UPI0003739D75|nr:isoprenylcysteine carboxylmethyltransferase family protein [Gayadomonas joobiniege]
MIAEFARWYLAIFFTFVACFYTIRIISLQQKSNTRYVHAGDKYSASWFNHLCFRVFRISIWAVCVVRFFYPDIDSYLGILPNLYQSEWILTGLILLTIGFVSTMYGHYALGPLWRSGMDKNSPNQLQTNGIYAYSRNPMYLSIAFAQLGFFLALPSAFSLICLIFGWIILYRQTLLEEAFLQRRFNEQYSQYKQTVRRWI